MNQTILLIRHAEKPPPTEDGLGLNDDSAPDKESLTLRGWQRAGMWAELFAPSLGQISNLPVLQGIYAAGPMVHHNANGSGSKSRRPLQTVTALAYNLNLPVQVQFETGQEADLGLFLISRGEPVVLVAWQHEEIAAIATAIEPTANIPGNWPGDRFNLVFRLDRAGEGSPYIFSQISPVMFGDDSASTL